MKTSDPPRSPDEEALGVIMAKYRLDMAFASIPVLLERHGLVPG